MITIFMKRITIMTLVFSLSGLMFGQGELDVYKLSKRELVGTARGVAMGGAFGALGADITGVAINPAGIGVYSKSEVVTTLNFQNTKTKTDHYDGTKEQSKFKFTFDNLGLVAVFPLDNDEVPTINFGFSYNKLASFDRTINGASAYGNEHYNTFGHYAAARAAGINVNLLKDDGTADFYSKTPDWISALAYNAMLIETNGTARYTRYPGLDGMPAFGDLKIKEKGTINSYAFNVGTTISDLINIGATVSITDINYKMYSSYLEMYDDPTNKKLYADYDLQNWMKTEGVGWQVKLGAIIKPIKELRIGLAYHTPTWYEMTDYYEAELFSEMALNWNDPGLKPGDVVSNNGEDYTGQFRHDYDMRTPDKWVLSVAGIIGQSAILSMDYEISNFKSMKLKYTEAEEYTNSYIKEDFRWASTLRFGAEYMITRQFAMRAGYAWMQTPLTKEFKDNGGLEIGTGKSIAHFTMEGDTHNFTYGLGYRFTPNFYVDLGFVYSTRKDDLYAFSNLWDATGQMLVESNKMKLKNNRFQGLVTLGFRL